MVVVEVSVVWRGSAVELKTRRVGGNSLGLPLR
jgi:hypothetical protein